MAVLEEGKRRGAFMVSEANETRSRSIVTVTAGQVFEAGQIYKLTASKAVAITAAADTIAGVIWDNVDATDGEIVGATCIVRDAEVNGGEITYFTGATDANKITVDGKLALLGIIVREGK